jgi:hypothetical protein
MKIETVIETSSAWRVIKSTLKPKRKGSLHKPTAQKAREEIAAWPNPALSWDPAKFTPEVLPDKGLLFLVPLEGERGVPYHRDELRNHLSRSTS